MENKTFYNTKINFHYWKKGEIMYYQNKLKKIIKNANISQKQIALKCNISDKTISNMINGKYKTFNKEINEKICNICNVDIRTLTIAHDLDMISNEFNIFLNQIFDGFNQTVELEHGKNMKELSEKIRNNDLVSFILYMLDSDNSLSHKNNNIDYEINTNIVNIIKKEDEHIILDNDKLEPIIPKNSKLYIDYKATPIINDIVYITKLDGTKEKGK